LVSPRRGARAPPSAHDSLGPARPTLRRLLVVCIARVNDCAVIVARSGGWRPAAVRGGRVGGLNGAPRPGPGEAERRVSLKRDGLCAVKGRNRGPVNPLSVHWD